MISVNAILPLNLYPARHTTPSPLWWRWNHRRRVAYHEISGFPLLTLVILRDSIRGDMYEISLVCLIAVAFFTLTCLLVNSLFDLNFGKEANKVIKISHLRDRSLPLIKIVSSIQVIKNKIIMQSMNLFRAILDEYLTWGHRKNPFCYSSLSVTFEAIEEITAWQVFARLYLVCYIPSPSYDISLNLDVIRKASRTCLFPEIQDWRFEMKMLYNMGQLLSVSLSSVERVLRSFRRARTPYQGVFLRTLRCGRW